MGENVQETYGISIPVIHGLDPAEPYFKGVPDEVCLESTDAEFVSIIHSDAAQFLDGGIQGLGIGYPVGHVDFWPNNGTDHPGCDQGILDQIQDNGGIGGGGIWEGVRDFVACNHLRAVRFFEESLKQTCAFKSYDCNYRQVRSYLTTPVNDHTSEFEAGGCLESWDTDEVPEMGFFATQWADQLPQEKESGQKWTVITYDS